MNKHLVWAISVAAFAFVSPAIAKIVTVGDGITTKGMFNGVDHQPFVQALAILPEGGVVEVLGGTYSFAQPVTIGADDIVVRGSNASILRAAGTGPIGIFDVQGDRVVIENLRFDSPTAAAQQSLIRVFADSFRLANSVLRAQSGALNHRLLDLGDGVSPRSGTTIEGNAFLFSTASAGVIAVRASLGTGMRMFGNDFTTDVGNSFGLCRYAVEFDREASGLIQGNNFQNLGSAVTPLESVIHSSADVEGHKLSITGNFFEYCLGPRTIHLLGGRYCSITGNVIGRMPLAVEGTISLRAAQNGASGESNLISGNQFHNVDLAILVANQDWSSIHGNQFTLCSTRQIDVASTAKGVAIVSNQFVSSGVATIPEAIRIIAGADHFVHDNQTLSQSAAASFTNVLNATTVDIQVADNWGS